MKPPAAGSEAPRKRITQSEILAALVERHIAQAGGEHSSVELTRNAKGDVQIKVTVRTGESDDVRTVDDAAAKARATFDALAMLYPMGSVAPSSRSSDD